MRGRRGRTLPPSRLRGRLSGAAVARPTLLRRPAVAQTRSIGETMARIPLRGALMGMPGLLAMAMTAPLTHAQAPERGSEEYQATDLGDQITVYIVLSAVGLLVICVCVSSIFRRCCKSTAAKARRRYLSGDEVIKEQVARFREKHPREKEPAPPRIDRFPPMEVDPFPLYKNPRKAKIHNPHRIMRVSSQFLCHAGTVAIRFSRCLRCAHTLR